MALSLVAAVIVTGVPLPSSYRLACAGWIGGGIGGVGAGLSCNGWGLRSCRCYVGGPPLNRPVALVVLTARRGRIGVCRPREVRSGHGSRGYTRKNRMSNPESEVYARNSR
eukprot:scaffold12673_cov33-Phaeocystis_antarctica.AAC.1